MACEYCASNEDILNTQSLVLFLDRNGNIQADVLYDPDEYLWESFVAKANYCPMCGEKLGVKE